MNIENAVNFKIAKIETMQFAILQESVNEDALQIESGFSFGIDADMKVVRTSFEYRMLSEQNIVLTIEAAILFEIETNCFESVLNKQTAGIIPKEFATHIAMTVVSVTRGILHEKTRSTDLNKFPLPTIDVQSAINTDIVIEKNG
jgi:hypothetical protein